MSEELIITEELINEFLDPALSKAYTWNVEKDLPATCKFQASFFDDHEKQYFFSFYRDSGLGKNARKVIFSVKKNKNLNPKINVDKGSFIKILGTIMQIYGYYKLNDADGKMSNSYGFQFPDSFAKYMPFVAKVVKRLFKTDPKARLDLYGAIDSLDNFTIMYYVNQSSSLPFFGGPKADLNIIRGPFYLALTGNHAKTDSVGQKSAADDIDFANFKLKDDEPAKPKLPTADIPKPKTVKAAKPAPVAKPEEVHPTSPDQVVNGNAPKSPGEAGWENPIPHVWFGGVDVKADSVVMKEDSGSSSLKKNDTAKIYGVYNKTNFMQHYEQFGITKNLATIFNEKYKINNYVLIVKKDKYVALPADETIATSSFDSTLYFLANSESGAVIGSVLPKAKSALQTLDDESDSQKISKLDKFKDTFVDKKDAKNVNLPDEFFNKMKDITIKIGPTTIPIGDDLSLIGVADKLKEIEEFFGKLPKDKVMDIAYKAKMALDHHEREATNLINKFLHDTNHFFGDNASSESVNAVQSYTGSAYGIVNKFLRGVDIGGQDKLAEKVVTRMDKGFVDDGVRFDKRLNVYRGASISQDDIGILSEGGAIPLTGYASVSFRPNIAYAFANTSNYSQEIVRGALIDFDDIQSGKQKLDKADFTSRQGNKILYTINRLDRCLAIAVDKISQNSGEDEIILNRGTKIQTRLGYKVQKVLDRKTNYEGQDNPNHGIWIAKVEIAPNAVSESSLKNYLLQEALKVSTDVQDNLAIVSFYIQDVLDSLPE